MVGVKPDMDALRANRVLSHRVRAAGESLPFGDASFDLVASAWVLEHLDNPGLVFSEIARVLRPRGRFVFLTPNAWNYNAWMIRAVPNRLHQTFTRRLYGRGEGDTYPVRYRANSASDSAAAHRRRRLHRRAPRLQPGSLIHRVQPALVRGRGRAGADHSHPGAATLPRAHHRHGGALNPASRLSAWHST